MIPRQIDRGRELTRPASALAVAPSNAPWRQCGVTITRFGRWRLTRVALMLVLRRSADWHRRLGIAIAELTRNRGRA